jgi:hypothetical protein
MPADRYRQSPQAIPILTISSPDIITDLLPAAFTRLT